MEFMWAPLAGLSLRLALNQVRPDCIWAIPHDWSILPLHKVLATNTEGGARKAKMSRAHVTIQDFPDVHQHGVTWGMDRVARMARMQEEIYRSATTCDATSLPMLAHLEQRTKIKGLQMLHQGLEKEDLNLLKNPPTAKKAGEMIKIAYAGTILVRKEFQSFVEALAILRQSLPVELHLWGAHSYAQEDWFRREWVVEHGNLPERDLITKLRKCDWGFIPMALEDNDPRYNRFSFPTKFISYLAAGLPVITMGHPECSVMKIAKAYNVGITIPNGESPSSALTVALKDPRAKDNHRQEILRCAHEQFDAEKMRKKLWACLTGE